MNSTGTSRVTRVSRPRAKLYQMPVIQARQITAAVPSSTVCRFRPRVVVFSLFGMMNWYYTWQHAAPELTGQELADGMTQIFLRGLLSSQSAVPQLVS